MATASVVNDLFSTAEPLFGGAPDDPGMETFLKGLSKWPMPAFDDEELVKHLEDKANGFALLFELSETVKHPVAQGKPAGTPLFMGGFFFSEGIDGYQAFPGKLPGGLVWSDSAASAIARLGPPQNEIMNKKTGALQSHRWPLGPLLLSARYLGGGKSLRHVYVGLT